MISPVYAVPYKNLAWPVNLVSVDLAAVLYQSLEIGDNLPRLLYLSTLCDSAKKCDLQTKSEIVARSYIFLINLGSDQTKFWNPTDETQTSGLKPFFVASHVKKKNLIKQR